MAMSNVEHLAATIFRRLHTVDDPMILRIYGNTTTEINENGKIRIPLHYLYAIGNPCVVTCHVVDNGLIITPFLCVHEAEEFRKNYAGNFNKDILLEELLYRSTISHQCVDFVLTNNKYAENKDYSIKPAMISFYDTQFNVEPNGDISIPEYIRNDVFPYKTLKCALLGGAIVLTSFYEGDKIVPVGGAIFTTNRLVTTAYIRELSEFIPENTPEDDAISFIVRRIEADSLIHDEQEKI